MLSDLFHLPHLPRPRAALPWTEERLRHLRRRWKQGARAREIGAEVGVSANAVIAKIHRLGIARLSPYGGAPGRRQKLQNIPRAARPQYARRRAFSLRRARPAPPLLKAKRYLKYARLDEQIPLAQRRSLLALGDDNCRWPVGEAGLPSFFFCGAQVLRNKPYCGAHCARAYLRPPPPRAPAGRSVRGETLAGAISR